MRHDPRGRARKPMHSQSQPGVSRRLVAAAGLTALAMLATTVVATAAAPKTKLINQSSAEVQTSEWAGDGDINAKGAFVVFVTA
jgi:hypothetical protein